MNRIKNHITVVFSIVLMFIFIASQSLAQNSPLNKNDTLGIPSNISTTKIKDGASDIKKIDSAKSRDQSEKDAEDEQDMMEKALDLIELADNYWIKGDIENALNTLDKAYALLLDANGNVAIARQKDDLRLLISRRILAVYSAHQTVTNGKASEIPLILNSDVEKEIRSFQNGEREFFISSYQRSGLYRDIIVKELKKAGVPEELFWLPLVESGFKISAYSRARALGLWQFIPSTGYKFGLSRDEWIDERMDVQKSTLAAIAYLKELHGMFGDWLTVLAAYNCGEGRVLRVISRQHINYFDRFWDLYNQLPNETARYVPRFLATLHIIKNPGKYGFNLQTTEKPISFETVKVNKVMKLQDVATKIEVSEELMNILNAELRHKITPDREYALKIPPASIAKINEVIGEIPEAEKPQLTPTRLVFIKHRVRQGETVASIAKRYKISSSTILSCNSINPKKGLSAGQRMKIPVYRTKAIASNKTRQKVNQTPVKVVNSSGTYKIKKGDTLLIIAKKLNVPVTRLKEINHLKSNNIKVGQTLRIPSEEASNNQDSKEMSQNNPVVSQNKTKLANKTLSSAEVEELGTNKHIVTKGDNLSSIAQKYKMNVTTLVKLNKLSGEETLVPGQILIVKN